MSGHKADRKFAFSGGQRPIHWEHPVFCGTKHTVLNNPHTVGILFRQGSIPFSRRIFLIPTLTQILRCRTSRYKPVQKMFVWIDTYRKHWAAKCGKWRRNDAETLERFPAHSTVGPNLNCRPRILSGKQRHQNFTSTSKGFQLICTESPPPKRRWYGR